jgi:hypothetical protein
MQKTTISLNKKRQTKKTESLQMQPSEESIQKILQFAALYRAEKLPETNRFVEMILN